MNSFDTLPDLSLIGLVSGDTQNRIIRQIENQVSYEVAIKLMKGISGRAELGDLNQIETITRKSHLSYSVIR